MAAAKHPAPVFATITLNPALDRTMMVAGELCLGGVHRVSSETFVPGGKGINVAKAVRSRGCEVLAGGLIGEDMARCFSDFLSDCGIRPDFLVVPHATRTNLMVGDGGRHEIKLNLDGFPGLGFDWRSLEAHVRKLSSEADIFILSGSLPARFPAGVWARMLRLLRGLGRVTALDTSGKALLMGVKSGPEVIKPNREELGELMGRKLFGEGDVLAALRLLSRRHEVVIMSDGARGAYFCAGGRVLFAQAPAVKAVDSTGAGDALLGRFCAEYFAFGCRNLSPEVAAAAVAAGSACAELQGVPMLEEKRVKELAARVRVRTLG